MNNLIREKIFRILYKLKLGKIFDEDLLWYRRGKYKLGISLLNALNSDSKYSYIGYQYNKAEELQWILKFLEKNDLPLLARFAMNSELGEWTSNGEIAVWKDEGYRSIFKELLLKVQMEVQS